MTMLVWCETTGVTGLDTFQCRLLDNWLCNFYAVLQRGGQTSKSV